MLPTQNRYHDKLNIVQSQLSNYIAVQKRKIQQLAIENCNWERVIENNKLKIWL